MISSLQSDSFATASSQQYLNEASQIKYHMILLFCKIFECVALASNNNKHPTTSTKLTIPRTVEETLLAPNNMLLYYKTVKTLLEISLELGKWLSPGNICCDIVINKSSAKLIEFHSTQMQYCNTRSGTFVCVFRYVHRLQCQQRFQSFFSLHELDGINAHSLNSVARYSLK
jgi:hypothetical protein